MEPLYLNHAFFAFQGADFHGDDVYTANIVTSLLGGGGSFSSGGPGKVIDLSLLTFGRECTLDFIETC